MIINERVLNLKQLNKHVLECTMPSFYFSNSANNHHQQHNTENNNSNSMTSNQFTTSIYIYENQRLFCPPIPFQIIINNKTFTSATSSLPNQISSNNNIHKFISSDYKSKFFLLERSLCLFKHNNWEKAYFNNNDTNNANKFSIAKTTRSFEDRISRLFDSFITHLSVLFKECDLGVLLPSTSMSMHMHESVNVSSDELNLRKASSEEDEYEDGEGGDGGGGGKHVLHLCASLGYFSLIEKLSTIKKMVVCMDRKLWPNLGVIEDELDLFNMDNNGDTAMVNFFLNI